MVKSVRFKAGGSHTWVVVQGRNTRDRGSRARRLVRVAATVRAEDTARGRAEADEECNHRAEHEPERIAIFGSETVLAILVLGDAEEYHGEHPCDDGSQHGECGEECHKNGACAVVTRTANTEQERKARETWTDRQTTNVDKDA